MYELNAVHNAKTKFHTYRGFLLRNFFGSISTSEEEDVEETASSWESRSAGADDKDDDASSVWPDLTDGMELSTTANTFTLI